MWNTGLVESNQSILKEIYPEYSFGKTAAEAEVPIFWPLDVKSWLIGKDSDAGKDWRQEEKVVTEDEMVWWHHWVNGHEFEQTLGDSEGQGNLMCYSPWGRRVRHNLVTRRWQYWPPVWGNVQMLHAVCVLPNWPSFFYPGLNLHLVLFSSIFVIYPIEQPKASLKLLNIVLVHKVHNVNRWEVNDIKLWFEKQK